MKKWVLAAFAYLLAVAGGYSVYAGLTEDKRQEEAVSSHHEATVQNKEENHEEESRGHDEEHSEHGASPAAESEVAASVTVQGQDLAISVKDLSGSPVTDLEINHEKVMHLIVVDTQLDKYVHLHPEQKESGLFTVSHGLPDGSYKAFIDIKPKQLEYAVQPVSFSIGEAEEAHGHGSLEVDQELIKTIDGRPVKLEPSSLTAGTTVELLFSIEGALETYLDAVGHVVILDEKAEQYVHVHPANETKPIFETQFEQPGIYKIWAEFKQDGKVRVYPFTIEVTQ